MSKRIYNILYLAGIIFIFAACKTTSYSNVDSGNIVSYVPGYPNFSIGAYSTIVQDESTGINIYLNIPYSNLIFKSNKENHTFTSKIGIAIQVTRIQPEPHKQITKNFTREINTDSYQETTGLKTYRFRYNLVTDPGNYRIVAIVSDQHSNKYMNHVVTCTIPDIQHEKITAGSVVILGKAESTNDKKHTFQPQVNYHLSSGLDSLKASVQLFVKSRRNNLDLMMHLYKFRSDTMPARPPNYTSPTQGSLEYRGIDFKKRDTLQTIDRQLKGISGTLTVDFIMPKLPDGNYRVEIEGIEHDSTLIYKARDFSIKGPGYPRLTTIKELAEATYYIAYPREFKKLMAHHNSDSLKKYFDSFWGKLFSNENLAKSVFDSYYSRIEKANMFFTSYKEGWKTDPGMIYILYGPPSYVERDVEGMVWHYSSHSDNLSGEFYFRKVYNSGGHFPFTHYLLVRNIYYERSFYSQVEDWRSGLIN